MAFSLVPGLFFLLLAAITLRQAGKMPKHPLLRIQKIGMGGFGAVLLLLGLGLLAPPIRNAVQPVFWFVIKVAVFMYMYIWYRGTFPRYRFDQLMQMGWKVLLPLGLAVLVGTAVAGLTPEIWGWIRGGA
jgi:NADH-quinone oxidoreductase subunit H